jgi:hypothetical protein
VIPQTGSNGGRRLPPAVICKYEFILTLLFKYLLYLRMQSAMQKRFSLARQLAGIERLKAPA